MKQIIKLRILLLILLLCSLSIKAMAVTGISAYTVITFVQLKDTCGVDRERTSDGPDYRSPSRPIRIFITKAEGVQIPQSDKGGIISYSVYNEDEECISTFTNEADFVDFVFTWTGTVQVRIEFADYYLAGWLEL